MLRFVTTNSGKLREAREYLAGIAEVEQFEYDYPEIQSDDLAEITAVGARDAYAAAGGPVFVEDSGLFIESLGGFPGPYSSYVYGTLGNPRVWGLVADEEDRRAFFRAVIAYYDGDSVETFEGAVPGRIVAPRGDGGFGFDPIFEHNGRTFAEVSTAEKNAVSHRGRALAKFARWLEGEPAEHQGAR